MARQLIEDWVFRKKPAFRKRHSDICVMGMTADSKLRLCSVSAGDMVKAAGPIKASP